MNLQPSRPALPGRVPPVNSRLCRRLGTVAAISGVAFLTVNTVMWLVPEMAPYAARGMANLQDDPITLTPMIRAIGLVGIDACTSASSSGAYSSRGSC